MLQRFFKKCVEGWKSIPLFPIVPRKIKRIRRRFPGTDQDCLSKDWMGVGMDVDKTLKQLKGESELGGR
jgi:hypothetical protein